MMIDIHNHTIFSDGRNTVEEVIQSASLKGLHVVGISDHFDLTSLRKSACSPKKRGAI
ncbi:PHP domain-containing protein [Mesotoga sp. Brook.08.YT.4.2.5.1]|uniref:PHP domain-containing protein n=1 Tax=Mesotoga sp. Brook.08.YT.4.2.5.1 TaxID=1421001 RepID=UPI0027E5274F|nr:PHP domain-containing protein [Mesotoga sp. Brook.08.YT.4.2.5.1]